MKASKFNYDKAEKNTKDRLETKKEIIGNLKKSFVRARILNTEDKYFYMFELLDQWHLELYFWESTGYCKEEFAKVSKYLNWFITIPDKYKKRLPGGKSIVNPPIMLINKYLGLTYGLLDVITHKLDLI